MKLEDLLTTYWPQTTLFLTFIIGLIVYFIKRAFDTKSKKIEVNHTLFQQNRLAAVNRFFENYSKVATYWNQIPIYDVIYREVGHNQMYESLLPILNELDTNIFELRIYFEDSDYIKFKNLASNLKSINEKILDIWFDISEITVEEKVKSYNSYKEKSLIENENLLDELTITLKEIFKS